MPISLREITADSLRQVMDLTVAKEQEHLVASNAVSLAEALFHEEAWYRAIYDDSIPVGFVMLYDETLRTKPPLNPKVFLWRFMVDAKFQGQGIGKAALRLTIAYLQSRGVFSSLATSYVPAANSPEPFYRSFGFRPTGEMDGDEVVLKLLLDPLEKA